MHHYVHFGLKLRRLRTFTITARKKMQQNGYFDALRETSRRGPLVLPGQHQRLERQKRLRTSWWTLSSDGPTPA